MTGDGGLVEVQATAERTPLSRAHLDELLALAPGGIEELRAAPGRRDRGRRRRMAGSCSPPATRTSCASSGLLPADRGRPLPDDVELPPETGDTFAENALVKARAAARRPARPRSPTTPASRPRRSAARPACCSARFAGERRHRRGEPRQAAARGARRQPGCATSARSPTSTPDGEERALRGPLRGHARRRAARQRRLRLRPGVRPRRRRRRPHDGRARRRREGRDQPPRPRRAGGGSWLHALTASLPHGHHSQPRARRSRSPPTAALIRAQGRGGRRHRLGGDDHRGDPPPPVDLIASVVAFVSVRKAEPPADADRPPLRPREGREPRSGRSRAC